MIHNADPLLEDAIVRTSLNKPDLRSSGSNFASIVILVLSCLCLLAVSTGLYFSYPIGIESATLCVLPHIIIVLVYMLSTNRYLCLESVIPFVTGAAMTVIVSVFLTLLQIDFALDALLTEGSVAYLLVFSFLRAAMLEEGVKLYVALEAPVRSNVLFSGVTGALGFAAAENLQYFVGKEASIPQLIARLITANVVHAGCTALILLFASHVKFRGSWVVAFILGVLFHGFYDFFVLSNSPVVAVATVQILIVAVASLQLLSDTKEESEDSNINTTV